jgi:hypothetical protein
VSLALSTQLDCPVCRFCLLQGNLLVRAKYWLPLQLAAYVSIIYWAVPFHVSSRLLCPSIILLALSAHTVRNNPFHV